MDAPSPAASAPPVDEAALRLVRQLDRSLDGHKASGDAFVASVYGEWGVGKTFCLKAVHDVYQQRMNTALASGPGDRLVVPVWFAPWRYEHEEHLVVPMLKTIEHTLLQVEQQVLEARDAAAKRAEGRDDFVLRNESLGRALKGGAVTVGRLAQALLSAVKFKAAPLGVGLEIDPKSAIEQSQKFAAADAARAEKGTKKERLFAQQRESIYFDAQTQLETLTRPHDAMSLRLVVLVDDLDRCLPEKAIQVLESVKLFLNVPGFSFVLAVDDEVVERGIAHRYKDYRLADRDGAFLGSIPISGTQYLEKIVHLPVYLPRWTRDKARAFLQRTYPDLYAPPEPGADPTGEPSGPGKPTPARDAASAAARSAPQRDATAAATLQMVLDAVPLVPRKLIRLSEGVQFLRAQFADQRQTAKWSPLHAVRVVALQQLHPVLYRHLRQRAARYWRLFDLERDAWGEPRYRGAENLATLKSAFEGRDKAVPDADPTASATSRQQLETQREKLDLLAIVEHSGSQRGAGDPVALFDRGATPPTPTELGLTQQSFSDLYFSAEPPPEATPAAAAEVGTTQLAEARVADPDSAVAALLALDAVSRQEFIEQQQLAGKLLPESVLQPLLAALTRPPGQPPTAHALDASWLRDMALVTSPEQLLALYDRARVVERWAADLRPKEVVA